MGAEHRDLHPVLVGDDFVPLAPTATALLTPLAERPGEVSMARLRALGVPDIVKTVVKRGYRLDTDLVAARSGG